MRRIIRKIALFVAGFATVLSLGSVWIASAQPAYAQVNFFDSCKNAPETNFCKNAAQEKNRNRILGPDGILTKVVSYITFVTAGVSIIVVIIGGLRYVISGGDSNGIKGAKDTIIYALIGLFISISAYTIAGFVLSKL